MSATVSGAPGRVAEFDKRLRLVREWPDNPPLDGFHPHGISARPDLNLMVTSDFINPVSTLNLFPDPPEVRGSIRCCCAPGSPRASAASAVGSPVSLSWVSWLSTKPWPRRWCAPRTARSSGKREPGLRASWPECPRACPSCRSGSRAAAYSLSFDARGREVWKLVPPTIEGGVPLLLAIDDRTVEVRAPDGTALAFSTTVPPDQRPRRVRVVPALITSGWQRLPVATAHTPRQSDGAVTSFRLTFDRPLAAYDFLHVSGRVELGRWRP